MDDCTEGSKSGEVFSKTASTPEQRAEAAKERDDAHASANKDQEEYDKQLLTLSVGSLTILLGFIKDLVKLPTAVWVPCFYLSCVCLFLCVLGVLGSYQYSIWVNRSISEHFAYKMEGKEEERPYPSVRARLVGLVNLSTGIMFALGLISAGTFVVWNIHVERREAMSVTGRPQNQPSEERGQFGKVQAPPANPKPSNTQSQGGKK